MTENVKKLKEPFTVHLAQAKCYAFIYGEQKQKEKCRHCT